MTHTVVVPATEGSHPADATAGSVIIISPQSGSVEPHAAAPSSESMSHAAPPGPQHPPGVEGTGTPPEGVTTAATPGSHLHSEGHHQRRPPSACAMVTATPQGPGPTNEAAGTMGPQQDVSVALAERTGPPRRDAEPPTTHMAHLPQVRGPEESVVRRGSTQPKDATMGESVALGLQPIQGPQQPPVQVTLQQQQQQPQQQQLQQQQHTLTRQSTLSNGSTASYTSTHVASQRTAVPSNAATSVYPQYLQVQQVPPPPPPPPPHMEPTPHYSPAQSSTSGTPLTGQTLVKKGRFTFVDTSATPVDVARKTILPDGTLAPEKVRKGRFLLSKPVNETTSTNTSQASVGSHSMTPAGTPEGTPGPPMVKKKGRFVITNVSQVFAAGGGIPVPTPVTHAVQPRAASTLEAPTLAAAYESGFTAPPAQPHAYGDVSCAMPQYQPVTQHMEPVPSAVEPATMPPQPNVVAAPSPTPGVPRPPSQPATPVPTEMLGGPTPATLTPWSQPPPPEHEQRGLVPQPPQDGNDATPDEKGSQSQAPQQPVRKVAPRTSLPRNSALGFAGREGLGKVFYFLDQMRLEVSDADRLIKTMQTENKCLKDKTKELEAKLRESERKLKEERGLRDQAEAKVKSLKKRLRAVKGEVDKETAVEDDPSKVPSKADRRPSNEGCIISQQIEKRIVEAGTLARNDAPAECTDKTPMKGTLGGMANKPSPESKIGGTPPRDPNSVSYSSSPVPSRTHVPLLGANMQKGTSNLLPRGPDSQFASLQGSPNNSPDKGALQQSQIPPLPGQTSQANNSSHGSTSPRNTQQAAMNASGWTQPLSAAHEQSLSYLSGTESSMRVDNSGFSRSAASEFDPFRQPATQALETIDGQHSIGRQSGYGASVGQTNPSPTYSSMTGLFEAPENSYNTQHLQQPMLSDPQQPTNGRNPVSLGQPGDSAQPPSVAMGPLPPLSLQQHGRALSWDALPAGGLSRNSSGTYHTHSNSHESLLAPKVNGSGSTVSLNQLPASDPFETLMSNRPSNTA